MRTCPNCDIETTLLECPRCGANLPRKPERPREHSPSGIELEVCHDIAARQAKGLAKYGVTVANNPLGLTEWLQHAYEEALDQAIYLKRAIRSLETEKGNNEH